MRNFPYLRDISIHALHEESDRWREHPNWVLSIFQSTLSMRRATGEPYRLDHGIRISIHALHEESDRHTIRPIKRLYISIHALHEESDEHAHVGGHVVLDISIHALHEESD